MSVYQHGILVVLALSVLLSALAVVYAKHQSRLLFVNLQVMQHERDRMDVEWGRLQLELSTLARPGRIERIAHARGMRVPEPAEVKILWQ